MPEKCTLHILPEYPTVRHMYESIETSFAYDGDSGLDLIIPFDVICLKNEVTMINHYISCEMRDSLNVPYFLVPRSSIAKTPLMMANSIGTIDAGYRGYIIAAVRNVGDSSYVIKGGTKLFQIVRPNLEQFYIKLVDKLSKSERGEKGFGSSTKTESK